MVAETAVDPLLDDTSVVPEERRISNTVTFEAGTQDKVAVVGVFPVKVRLTNGLGAEKERLRVCFNFVSGP